MKKTISSSLEDTKRIAISLVEKLKPNTYILLSGDLGAGKTLFTKMLLSELGIKDNVTSPTFVIMNQYKNKGLKINHVDAYRLNKDSEIDIFVEEFNDAVNIIEWYKHMNIDFDKVNWIKIKILRIDDHTREFKIEEK